MALDDVAGDARQVVAVGGQVQDAGHRVGAAGLVAGDREGYGGLHVQGHDAGGYGGVDHHLDGDGREVELTEALQERDDEGPAARERAEALLAARAGDDAELVAADDLHVGKELDEHGDAHQGAEHGYEGYHLAPPLTGAAGMASARTSTPKASAKVFRKSAKARGPRFTAPEKPSSSSITTRLSTVEPSAALE